MVGVRLVIEGGKAGEEADAEFRENVHRFIKSVLPRANSPRVTAAGSRDEAFKRFKFQCQQHPDHFVLLLVDSEDPVNPVHTAWDHVCHRDKWSRPNDVSDDQAHLMVRSMECWFLADKQALDSYFGNGFNLNALPATTSIEDIDRHEATDGIDKAAKNTRKSGYHKSRDGFKLIGLIDGNRVQSASVHAKRFFDVLRDKLGNRR